MLQKLKTNTECHSERLVKNLKTNLEILRRGLLRMTILLWFCVLSFTLFASPVYAACDPNLPVEQRGADCPAGLDQLEQIVGNVISVIVGLGFIASLVLIIMAGFKYLTSGGEPKAIQSSHHTLTWALLGIFFMIIAWLILQLISAFTGLPVTVFDIKSLCNIGGKEFCKPN